MNEFALVAGGLVALRMAVEYALARLNEREVRAHAGAVPAGLREVVDEGTYRRAVAYTLAKSRLGKVEVVWEGALLTVVLFSGILPWWMQQVGGALGPTVWGQAATLFLFGVTLSLVGLPLEWYRQFRLEQAHGFNAMTSRLWVVDRLKGLLLAAALGMPLLAMLLKVQEKAGAWWWFWAWWMVLAVQIAFMGLFPSLILPWFNKLTPLPEGALRERLLTLAQRSGFPTRQLFVMDGSRRSRHANAFLAGAGRWRKVVLFDTLLHQLSETELEAVLAHEIGHHRRRHLWKLLSLSAAGLLAGFYLLGWLAQQPEFFAAFGFTSLSLASALLLYGLLGGLAGFWLAPLWNALCRRFEYEADAFAARLLGSPEPLMSALRKLNRSNLSNYTPHPWFSRFYYSHPTLLEREKALLAASAPGKAAGAGERPTPAA